MGLLSPSDWFLSSADIEKGKALDQQLDELNQKRFEDGQISAEELERRRMSQAPSASGDYKLAVDQAWSEGWREGEQNVTGAVAGTVSAVTGTASSLVTAPLKGLFSGLPWWAWILGLGALLAWSGLLPGVVLAVRNLLKK